MEASNTSSMVLPDACYDIASLADPMATCPAQRYLFHQAQQVPVG
jgi:hypothetical protein